MRHLLRRDLIDPELVETWAHGWARSRGKPIARAGAALRIEVDEPDQRRRYVFPAPPAGVADIAAADAEPLVFLKVPAPLDAVRGLLPPGWLAEQTGTFMTLDALPQGAFTTPPGYGLALSDEAGVTFARIRSSGGEIAAQGRLVVVDGLAIHDRIRTEPAHERRGMGRTVMTALGVEARRRGATTGALVATPAGARLYGPLGWDARAPYVTAQVRRGA